jgi:hypothetical protein
MGEMILSCGKKIEEIMLSIWLLNHEYWKIFKLKKKLIDGWDVKIKNKKKWEIHFQQMAITCPKGLLDLGG